MTEVTTNQSNQLLTPLQEPDALLRNSEEGKIKIKQILLTCCAIYPTYGKSDKDVVLMFHTYLEFLGVYESGKVQNAFNDHIRTKTTFPTIADIYERVKEVYQHG